jgi:ketosteroid isomerase-like protein
MPVLMIAASALLAQANAGAPPWLATAAEVRAKASPPTPPLPGDPVTVATIRKLERDWGQAFPRRDFALIEAIVAPEFRLASTGPQGTLAITSRADWMRNSRAVHHLAFAEEVIDVMTAGDTAVALVRTAWTVQPFADRPAQARRGLCADTWLRRAARWQVVYRNCNREPAVALVPAAPRPR